MTAFTIAYQERQERSLRNFLFSHPLRSERAAFLLFGVARSKDPFSEIERETYLLKEVVLLQDATVNSSRGHVTWSNDDVIPVLKKAAKKGYVFGIAHSHIDYPAVFSSVDDEGERGLIQLIQNRNGAMAKLISLVFSDDGGSTARVWSSQNSASPVSTFRVIGDRYFFRNLHSREQSQPELARQALVFGNDVNKTLSGLTFTLVGCGGTGSAVAMLLARLGGRNFVLIDDDVVELSNLNRLHGARHSDVEDRRAKVDVVARNIRDIAPTARVQVFKSTVDALECRSALLSSDVVFGCTDDNRGRILINRLAYFYLIPVIDLGLAIEVSKTPPYRLLALDGRVTCIGPGETCLLCRGVVSPRLAREEALKAADPVEYARQKAEAYVIGEGNPSPAVVTFTTEVATMALNELLQRLQGFRGAVGSTPSRTRQFHRMHDLRPADAPQEDCLVCGTDLYWGVGDVVPFLDQVW